MARIGREDKEYQRKIAAERVNILLSLAQKTAKDSPDLSRRYVELAVRVARKHRVKLGKRKYLFCRKCYTWWTPETLRVRLVTRPYPMVVYKCLHCGAEYRIPYIREKKKKKEGGSKT